MKRLLSLILCVALLTSIFSGCAKASPTETTATEVTTAVTSTVTVSQEEVPETTAALEATIPEETIPTFTGLSDPDLLTYVEDTVYTQLVAELDSDDYFVENVEATFISEEYLSELSYNSQANIYFGYTLAELDSLFQGDRYVFTLGNDGQTTVRKMEVLEDTTYEDALKNIAIGTGVILVCVTISSVSAGVGAPAACMIFAASAKTGAIMASSGGLIAGTSAWATKLYETGDIHEANKAALLAGSEGFKWGAMSGARSGGTTEAIALHGATLHGLTMNEAALIQKESKLPLEFIKNFHSVDEYNYFKEIHLASSKVNGNLALTQKIDWNFIGDLDDGRTNAQRVIDGLAPLDNTGNPYQLHHIGQMQDSPLAVLTKEQHTKHYSLLHTNTGSSESLIDRNLFAQQKKAFWFDLLQQSTGGV